MTLLAFWFLTFFERLSWVALVAVLIPFIDAFSVWRGPTHHIVTQRREVFTTLSFAFPVPGENASANLGLPDLLFFALFLAAAVRWFGLRVSLDVDRDAGRGLGATIALAVRRGTSAACRPAADRDRLPRCERGPDLARPARARASSRRARPPNRPSNRLLLG